MKKFLFFAVCAFLFVSVSCSKKTYTTDDSGLNYESYKTSPSDSDSNEK